MDLTPTAQDALQQMQAALGSRKALDGLQMAIRNGLTFRLVLKRQTSGKIRMSLQFDEE